jgi:hypothetical protein
LTPGLGTLTYSSGNKYFGQWKKGKKDGFGIMYYSPNNTDLLESYEGEWIDDQRHGNGILTWIFGDRYEGSTFARLFVSPVARNRSHKIRFIIRDRSRIFSFVCMYI